MAQLIEGNIHRLPTPITIRSRSLSLVLLTHSKVSPSHCWAILIERINCTYYLFCPTAPSRWFRQI
ncbi:MAG TPA: hypothetical protein VF435_13050, partial [Pyrinomonadaceae bacterium]